MKYKNLTNEELYKLLYKQWDKHCKQILLYGVHELSVDYPLINELHNRGLLFEKEK